MTANTSPKGTERGQHVGARRKLNNAAILGSLVLASGLGYLSESWLVFIVAALILLVLSWYSGDIRKGKRGDW